MTESDRQRQLAHVRECLALCDRTPTPQQLADAEFLLSQPPRAPRQAPLTFELA